MGTPLLLTAMLLVMTAAQNACQVYIATLEALYIFNKTKGRCLA